MIVLCFVALGLQLAMGSNAYIPDDEDYNYSGSAGECRLFVKVQSIVPSHFEGDEGKFFQCAR